MKYVVLCAPDEGDLETQVMNNLKQGWKLQGGVSVSPMERDDYRPGTLLFSQAMVIGSVRQWSGAVWGILIRICCRA